MYVIAWISNELQHITNAKYDETGPTIVHKNAIDITNELVLREIQVVV